MYYYKSKVLEIPGGGYEPATQKGYMSGMECETACSLDDDCYAAMYTDTVNSSANDNACWHYGEPTGTPTTWTTHTHYSTLVKEPFESGGFPNPKFVDGKPILDGTVWSGTDSSLWETFSSPSAHGTVYLSWHPFAYTGGKQYASFTGQDKPHVGIKYPKPVVLNGFIIESTSDGNNYIPGKLVVEGSNNGTDWNIIKETTTPAGVVGYNKNRNAIIARETLKNVQPYTHFRVRVTSDGRTSVYNNINEFRLFTTLG